MVMRLGKKGTTGWLHIPTTHLAGGIRLDDTRRPAKVEGPAADIEVHAGGDGQRRPDRGCRDLRPGKR
jgi:hypothetical protein